MKLLPSLKFAKSSQSAFSLLEILVVLAIIGAMLALAIVGVTKLKQVMVVSNTAKEIVLQLRNARRHSITNVVTKGGYSPEGYYIYFEGDDYYWGECGSGCAHSSLMKSEQYKGVKVTQCDNSFSVIKFKQVTGEFIVTNDVNDTNATPEIICIIEVSSGSGGFISTKKQVEVNGSERTIKIK